MPSDSQLNHKRIAKNTFLLYIRMALTMLIALYTSRVILRTLGVTDFGIYNVVGGVVTLFSFLNGAMSSTTQRYITFCIGKNDVQRLNNVFCTAINVHIIIIFFVVFCAETIGLWFMYTQMQIPSERLDAAFWVFQCSLAALIVMIVTVPHNAAIIAHERMSAFAYISIIEVILKLFAVLILDILPFDSLKSYAILLFCAQSATCLLRVCYCRRNFTESHYRFRFDGCLMREMSSFAGWSLWGNIASVMSSQGVNMLLNVFLGPTINAARGITVQLQGVIQQFSTNFQTAINPQITKTYAAGQLKDMHRLIFSSSKFSALLLLILTLPILIETPYILHLWLGHYPEHTINFTRICLLISIFESTTYSLIIANQATGRVKKYQAVTGGILLLIVPISYIALHYEYKAESVFIVQLIIVVIAQISRMLFLRNYIQLRLREYAIYTYCPLIISMIAAFIPPFILTYVMPEGFLRLIVISITSTFSSVISIYFIGLNAIERGELLRWKNKFLKKFI